MRGWTLLGCVAALAWSACAPTSGSDAGAASGLDELYLNDQLLSDLQVTALKGRCALRLTIRSQSSEARDAVVAFTRSVSDAIPLDGSAPASDAALVALVPRPPLAGSLAPWTEDLTDNVQGPWLTTTSAWDWIDGSGVPFDDNGFEAVAGDKYNHGSQGWSLLLEVVNLKTAAGAEAAFRQAAWDQGTRL